MIADHRINLSRTHVYAPGNTVIQASPWTAANSSSSSFRALNSMMDRLNSAYSLPTRWIKKAYAISIPAIDDNY